MGNNNKGLTVKGRIYGGFSSVLALLAIVAVIAFVGFTSIGGDLERYVTLGDNTLRTQMAEREFTEIRRQVLLYAEKDDDKAIERIRDILPTLRKRMEEAVAKAPNQERRGYLTEMQSLLDRYAANLDKVIQVKAQRDKDFAELANLGIELRKTLTALIDGGIAIKDWETASYAGKAQEQLMLMRFDAIRFRGNPEQKHVDSFKERSASAVKAIKFLFDTEKDVEHRRFICLLYT